MDLARKRKRKRHPEINYGAISRHFKDKRANLKVFWTEITGPYDLFLIELRRDQHALRYNDGVPADVFVFAEGEPEDRSVTKIGGLPYWPACKPWPASKRGRPTTFLGQINFQDSLDITGKLPGDVLLLFAEQEDWLDLGETAGPRFEWMEIRDQALINAADVPRPAWEFATCYGAIHRTADYPNSARHADPARRAYEASRGHRRAGVSDRGKRSEEEEEFRDAAIIIGTKIGGSPGFIQNERPPKGKFLFQLNSISPNFHQDYPWVNVPTVPPARRAVDPRSRVRHELMIGDVGGLYVFLEPRGKLNWTA